MIHFNCMRIKNVLKFLQEHISNIYIFMQTKIPPNPSDTRRKATITNEGTRLHNKEELQSYPQTSTVRNYLSYTLVIDTRQVISKITVHLTNHDHLTNQQLITCGNNHTECSAKFYFEILIISFNSSATFLYKNSNKIKSEVTHRP